jgi:hypothetical protein
VPRVASEPVYDDDAMQALVRAYIACRLAVNALADLPADLREVIEEPVTLLCQVVGPELERVNPGFLERHRGA